MNYIFLVLKNSIRGLKMSFSVNFWFIPGKISAEKKFWKIFIAPKDSSLNFRGSLLSYFWAIMLIFAVMSISEDFGSLLPARSVAVKCLWIIIINNNFWFVNDIYSDSNLFTRKTGLALQNALNPNPTLYFWVFWVLEYQWHGLQRFWYFLEWRLLFQFSNNSWNEFGFQHL